MTDHRDRAAAMVEVLATLLADPDRVGRLASDPSNVDRIPGVVDLVPWQPAELAGGHPGIALLFAELATSAEPAEPATPAERAERAERAEPIGPAGGAGPARHARPAEPVDSTGSPDRADQGDQAAPGGSAGHSIGPHTGRTVGQAAGQTAGQAAGPHSRHRATAHGHLAAGAAATAGQAGRGLYSGPAGLGFAARATARGPADYRSLRTTVDGHVRSTALALVREETERMRVARAGTLRPGAAHAHDVISGLTGLGRCLLDATGDADRAVLHEVLTCLVDLTEPLVSDGVQVPGWWVGGAPSLTAQASVRYTRGYFNLGVAHGITGPLALLCLALRAGTQVTGQRAAIDRIVAWLRTWQHPSLCWPGDVSWPEQLQGPSDDGPPGDRAAWCYGTPGVAAVLYLAGVVCDRPDLADTAVRALRALLDDPVRTRGLLDAGICHGWAGLLHLTGWMAAHSGDEGLAAATHPLAAAVLDRFEPDAPFGYRYRAHGFQVGPDRPGFLEGTAGIALALHAYATATPPRTGWDAALLLT